MQDTSSTVTAVLRLEDLQRTFHQAGRAISVLERRVRGALSGRGGGAGRSVGRGQVDAAAHRRVCSRRPTAATSFINGRDCARMSDDERTRVRRAEMGFVYQFHQLLPEFSALENVMIPQLIQGRSKSDGAGAGGGAAERPRAWPSASIIGRRELSGGEQQRTAIGRALANAPRLLLADEPTGNLDPQTSGHVFDELIALIERTGVAALIATHNLELARRMHRVLRMEGGLLVEMHPGAVA